MNPISGKIFLGVGTAFPIVATEAGSLQQAQYEESVRQSIGIILGTAKGERVMRPDFGCGIHELVFDTVSATTYSSIVAAVRDALLRFEPRIDVGDVTISSGGQTGEVLLISINYEVRATNNAFNLVYPFYLDAGASA